TEIANPSAYINTVAHQLEIITAEVYNLQNNSCRATTSFLIQSFDNPQIGTNILPIQRCDDTSFGTDSDGRVVFNLTERQNSILNGQSSSTFTV
ncbi:hypothetical protein, partial [Priestia megaterium]|uniref:hypothetical protein n=1 Tax=Priestia megaterium TaxID=1404 RepID=UPI0035B6AB49